MITGSQGEGPAATCFWGRPEASVGPLTEANETYPALGLAPDTDTDYYVSVFQLPAGATVTLHGQFPHARFMSFTAYKNVAGQNGIPGNSLIDEDIAPDAGSVNPFVNGESRNAPNRSFTITISGEIEPASPAPNTLYAGQEGLTGETQTVEVIERVYSTDRGFEAGGGVPLPAPTYNPASGGPVSGESEVCSDLSVASGPTALNESKFGVSPAQYKALRSGLPGTKEPATHPAVNPIHWEKFFNQGYLVAPFYRGTAYEPLIAGLSTEATSGLYATPANAYALAYASRLFGPNPEGQNILVLHAKMPTHPDTYEGNTVSEDGATQVRYWSLCNYTGISKGALLEPNSACLFDQEVPTNSSGYYTVVISLSQDRPANARPGCGVAWMNWGTRGDGEGRPDLDALIVRNQLSSPSFAQSIEKVQHPGEEEAVMGEYYPHGTYETQQEFEANYTCAPATPGSPHLMSGSSPNKGAFTLAWSAGGEAESVEGVTFTLQHKDHNGGWATVAAGLTKPEYTFTEGSPEAEGTWTYRVKASGESESAYSGESGEVKVERAGPPAPTATTVGSPVYEGWYRDSAEVEFSANGAGTLPDESEGAALQPSSLTEKSTVSTTGTHTVCGTIENVLGETSGEGCTTVKVDATPPTLTVSCPATAELDASGATASYSASDGQSGLASSPAGRIAIPTGSLGEQSVSETASDNVGNETTRSCATDVVYAFSKLKPVNGKEFKVGKAVAVSFHLGDALGYVTDGSATLEIAPEGGSFTPATSATDSGDKFANMRRGLYSYSLSTTGLAKGSYTLRVNVSDGTAHTTRITIK
ncbi:MAG TPA: hypothetical protein VMA83_10400 [Solirubrobacteraceae bacterium]|nr:hypothetical protein [Solirubrobacteraceae bacterium]